MRSYAAKRYGHSEQTLWMCNKTIFLPVVMDFVLAAAQAQHKPSQVIKRAAWCSDYESMANKGRTVAVTTQMQLSVNYVFPVCQIARHAHPAEAFSSNNTSPCNEA